MADAWRESWTRGTYEGGRGGRGVLVIEIDGWPRNRNWRVLGTWGTDEGVRGGRGVLQIGASGLHRGRGISRTGAEADAWRESWGYGAQMKRARVGEEYW